MKKLYYYDDKIFTIKELEEYTRMKELWIYKELIEKDKVKVIENMSEIINMYDRLVFEDESGSIYQDCVCEIENNPVHVAYTEDEEDEYFHTVICNQFEVHLDSDYDIIKIKRNNDGTFNRHEYNLKEIWTRTDEDTYKKVWENK